MIKIFKFVCMDRVRVIPVACLSLMIRLEGEDISSGLLLIKVEQGLAGRFLVEELWDTGTS